MARTAERLPVEPLVRVLEQEVEKSDRATVAERIGINDRTLYRYLNRLDGEDRPLEEVDLATVDRILLGLDIEMWEVYPDPDRDDAEVYCAECREMVIPDDDGLCLWCDRDPSAPYRGGARKIGPDVFWEAQELYNSGLSLRQVAERIFPRTGYSNVVVCQNVVGRAFARRGWTRSRAEGLRLSHEQGHRRHHPCRATTTRGRPCRKSASRGEKFCASHEPASRERMAANLRRSHQERAKERVSSEPYCQWVERRVADLGSLTELARQLGVSVTTVWNWVHRRCTTKRSLRLLEPATVRKYLQKDGTVTFEDLYG